jgi:hypothetical protein
LKQSNVKGAAMSGTPEAPTLEGVQVASLSIGIKKRKLPIKRKCLIDGCDINATRRKMCNNHYRHFMKYGDPLFFKNRKQGEGALHNSGYWMFEINKRSVLRHILIVEKVLGKRLPKGVEVHHVDLVRANDSNNNLVACQDRTYHRLLHKRTKALHACGHADWISCQICKQYSPSSEIKQYKNGVKWHPKCWTEKFGKRGKIKK